MSKAHHKRNSIVILRKDLWVAPHSNLGGPDSNRTWDNKGNSPPTGGAGFLELADVALGHKKSSAPKKKPASEDLHQKEKSEPYSN